MKYDTKAFATRVPIGIFSTAIMAFCCTIRVTTLEIMVKISSGIFSRIKKNSCDRLDKVHRRRGQKSRRSSTNGKQACHDSATPWRFCQLNKNPEQCQRVRQMKKNICEVVCSRIETVQLHIQHVRYPRERMPVRCVSGGDGPQYAIPSQTAH